MTTLLVGRAGELDLLFDAAHRLTHGRGALVHLVGEAGIGKTSLLAAAADDLRSRRVAVRAAAADETDRRRRAAVLRALLPDAELGAAEDPVDATIAAVERLAAGGPVALLADDLHWADDASLEGLRAVGRRAEGLGTLLVTTARPEPSSHGLRRFEEMVRRDATMLDVGPLDAEQLAELVEHRFGARPGPRLRTLLETTAGNPFLAAELLASLPERRGADQLRGVIDLEPDADVPGDLVDRLAARALASVGDSELLLRALAVVPGGASADELADVVGRPLGDVLDVALEAVRSAVLVDTGTALLFRHELLRSSVATSTPPSIARTLSKRAADVLVARRADPERITACLLAGVAPGDPSDVERLISFGTSLADTHPSAAADLISRALPSLPSRDPRAGGLTVTLGWALVAAGRAGEVDALLGERLGPFHDAEPIAVHRLRGIAASLTGRVDVVAERYEGADVPRLVAHYDTDDPEVVDAAAELAMLRISCGQPREAAEILEWIDRSTTRVSPFRASTVSTVRAQLATVEGRFEVAAAEARAGLSWAQRDPTGSASAATPALALAIALDLLGDADGSLAVSRGRAAVSTVPRWGPPLLQFFGSLTLFRRGDWDDALAEVDAGLVAADDADLGMGVFWPYSVAALIATARGRHGDAREWLRRSQEGGARRQLGGEWLVYAAALSAEAGGDVGAAVPLIEAVVAKATTAGAPAVLVNGGPEMVRLAIRAGRSELAKTIAGELETVASRTASPVAAGITRWAHGLLDEDAALVVDAASTLAQTHRAPEAARADHGAALIAARAGDDDGAREAATRALATYDELEAAHWRHQLVAELSTVGVAMRPRRRAPRPSSGWPSLTASEETIVALVGEGHTNTAIAEQLYVSRRTIESHLGRVYTKLGLHTRAELVAAAVRRPPN